MLNIFTETPNGPWILTQLQCYDHAADVELLNNKKLPQNSSKGRNEYALGHIYEMMIQVENDDVEDSKSNDGDINDCQWCVAVNSK